MSRPHEWDEPDPSYTRRCVRCGIPSIFLDQWTERCPVVTAADAFGALEWVLGQVWRTLATARLLGGHTVRVGVCLVSCCRAHSDGRWAIEWCGSDRIWERRLVGDAYEALAGALDLIERLGDE